MPSFRKKELYVFEGFTNRVNALASALLRWEDGFLIRWMENRHCPVAFGELFEGFSGVDVSSDSGSWQEYHYENSDERLCHYFLSTKRDRRAVKRAYELILKHCRIGAFEDELGEAGKSVAFHYRKHIEWAKAPESVCLDLLAVLCDRTAASQVLLASDDDETALRLAEKIQKMGFPVKLLGHGAGLKSDFDRDQARVLEFVRVWRTLTECRWAISNAISSTVLDASRALGNEVWTFGDLRARTDHGCAFFHRFGFDWLVAGSALQVSGKEERKIMRDFSEDYGKRLISYCLFGDDAVYVGGILRNLREAEVLYPDWQVIVFVDGSVAMEVRGRICAAGGKVVEAGSGLPLTVERFLPALDEGVDLLLVRDADSSLTPREVDAVDEWIESGKSWHVMRDHPHHQAAVMGGMWGCRGGSFEGLTDALMEYEFSGNYGEDQEFLEECVWRANQAEALVHDSHGSFDGRVRAFPEPRKGRRFVGERVTENGEPFTDDHELIEVEVDQPD